MNAVNLLIALCALVVVGVFAFSFGGMKKGISDNPSEKEKLKQELAMLKQMSYADVKPKVDETALKQEEVDLLKAEVESLKEKQRLAEEAALAATAIVEEEALPAIDPADEKRLQRRAKIISQAMVMAQVNQFYPQDGFASIKIINYENVQTGIDLAIRRNTGIVGQLRVTTVEGNEAIADVISHTFLGGEIDVQPGDELILNPL